MWYQNGVVLVLLFVLLKSVSKLLHNFSNALIFSWIWKDMIQFMWCGFSFWLVQSRCVNGYWFPPKICWYLIQFILIFLQFWTYFWITSCLFAHGIWCPDFLSVAGHFVWRAYINFLQVLRHSWPAFHIGLLLLFSCLHCKSIHLDLMHPGKFCLFFHTLPQFGFFQWSKFWKN